MGITSVQILLATLSSTMLSPGHNLPLLSNFINHIKHCSKCRINQSPSVSGILHEMNSHHSIQTPSLSTVTSLFQTICLMPTLYNTTNPTPFNVKFSDSTIQAYHHENKTCTCDHLDWIIAYDISFPLHDGDYFAFSSWPGIIFQFI